MPTTINGKIGAPPPPVISPEVRQAELERTLRELHRRFGAGVIRQLGDTADLGVEAISTGYSTLDISLGVGGLPRGRIIDIYGPESSGTLAPARSAGETTLCLKVIAEGQKQGGVCAFIDMEHALDLNYAARCGVNLADLHLAQPASGEEALEIAEALVRVGVAVVIIDSAASLVPRAEIEGEMGDNHAGLQARLMSQALRTLRVAGPVRANNTVLIFTNQLRVKVGILFGNPETPTGGMALRFYASLRIELRRIQALKSEGEVIGARIKATVKKNKVAPPYRSAELDLLYGG